MRPKRKKRKRVMKKSLKNLEQVVEVVVLSWRQEALEKTMRGRKC